MTKSITSIISIISISLLVVALLCGCGKKNDKDASGSKDVGSTESQVSMTEGTDEISVQEIEENAIEVDFETGSVISAPSNKDNSSSEASKAPVMDEAGVSNSSTASGSSTSSGSSASSSSSSSASSDAANSSSESTNPTESQETMGDYKPWQ